MGKGGVQIKSLEGIHLKTIAVSEEIVPFISFRKPSLMFLGFNSTINFYCWDVEMVKSHFGISAKEKLGRSQENPKSYLLSAHIKLPFLLRAA